MTTIKNKNNIENKKNLKTSNLKTTKKRSKSNNTTNTNTKKNNNSKQDKNKQDNTKKSVKKKTIPVQGGGGDVCTKDLNELLTGNPMVNRGKKIDFAGELSKSADGTKKYIMGSFNGVERGWGGNPGMPPQLPSGCTIL